MPSKYWDEMTAERYGKFCFEFPSGGLAGRAVVVAGGTGGLGAATVILLASEGARLIVGYRSNRVRAAALASAVHERYAQSVLLVEGDIADAEVRQKYLSGVEQVAAPFAGAVIFPGEPSRVPLEEMDRDALVRSLEANFIGPVLLGRDLGAPLENAEPPGSLVLVATMQAVAVFETGVNYAAPKAALVHAARMLAKHWLRARVNVVAPGASVTGMAESTVRAGKYDPYLEGGAIPRFGRPEDVARAVRFFLEPDNYVTGQILLVDGGLTLRRDRG